MIVLDASVLTDFLLGRPPAMDALAKSIVEREHEPFHAPELIEPETLNALRRLVLNGALPEERASEAAFDLGDMRLVRYPHAPLRERIWDLRHNLSAYDATYLALTEALGDALLVTCDSGLASYARKALGGEHVRQVTQ